MSAVTRDVVLKPKKEKKRSKGVAALRAIRRAIARRKLEEMRDEELLQEQLYDVFEDNGESD